MTGKITFRHNGSWAIIGFGLSVIGYWLVALLFAWWRAREGAAGMGIDAVAASTTLALKGMAVGMLVLAIGIAVRLATRPRPRNP